jgi:hypothetical protein
MREDPARMERQPSVAGSHSHHRQALRERAVEEVKRFLVMFLYIYLWAVLFEVHQWVILRQVGHGVITLGFAFFNALVLAKVMLIAEDLKLGRWLRPEPLIYPILGECLIFSVVFIVFHVVEHMVIGFFKGETVAASVPVIGGGGIAGLLSVALIYFVALVPYFGFRHVSRELGEGRLKAILFGVPGAPYRHSEHVRRGQS